MEEIEILKRVPFFSRLSEKELQALKEKFLRRTFWKKEVIFHQGDEGHALYIILEGEAKVVTYSSEGKESILALLGKGDFFGELSLLDGKPRSATVVALSPLKVLMLFREDLLSFFRSLPEESLQIAASLATRLRSADEMVEEAAFLDIPGRLAKKLLELGQKSGKVLPEGIEIELSMTQAELGSMIGATRQRVNGVLSNWQERGLICLGKKGLTILKPEELKRRIY